MTTAAKVLSELRQHAEAIKTTETRRFGSEWMPGDVAAQGDLNIVCIASMPTSAKARKSRQMADGSTLGSRHILERGECFDANRKELAALIKKATGVAIQQHYIGPVFCGPAYLDHPEHAHQEWTEPCVNVVTYQRVLDADGREQRVSD